MVRMGGLDADHLDVPSPIKVAPRVYERRKRPTDTPCSSEMQRRGRGVIHKRLTLLSEPGQEGLLLLA